MAWMIGWCNPIDVYHVVMVVSVDHRFDKKSYYKMKVHNTNNTSSFV